ncbi:MAG TPA: PIN domain-containing protein [Rubrivivax sp.]|nr:PIN domain-containing protein [Rubrivivax sp.]
MSAEVFIDTNVFVYHVEDLDRRKQRIAEGIIRDALASGSACISYQVVQEWLNTFLRKAVKPLPDELARDYLDQVLWPLVQTVPSAGLYRRALELRKRWQLGFYDALIVAAALQSNCSRLLSEDLSHGQRIEGLKIENPFA